MNSKKDTSLADPQRILRAVNAISGKSDTVEIGNAFAKELGQITGADLCCVYYGGDMDGYNKIGVFTYGDVVYPALNSEEYKAMLDQLGLADQPILYIDPEDEQFASGYLLPLKAKKRMVGVAHVFFKEKIEPVLEKQAVVLLLAEHAGLALDDSNLLAEAHQRTRELETIYQTSLAMTSSEDLEKVLEVILEGCLAMHENATNAYLFFYEDDKLEFAKGVWSVEHESSSVSEPRQDGLTYAVARGGKMILVPDMQEHPLYENAPPDWTGSIFSMPLKLKDEVIGVINIGYAQPQKFTESDVRLVQLLADQAVVSIDHTRALRAVRRRAAQLEALRQASLALTASLELEDVFDAILKSSLRLSSDALDSHIFLYEESRLDFVAALFADGRTLDKPFKEPREDGLTQRVARTGKMIVVENVREHELFQSQEAWTETEEEEWSGAIAGVPLKVADEVVGVLNIAFSDAYKFTEEELYILELLADQAAVAIENARLHRLVREQAITDPLTQIHNRRAFENQLFQKIEEASQTTSTFVLMMMDLNGFKHINDVFGHAVGDRVLARFAREVDASIRKEDFFARFGGDEFIAILSGTDYKQALKVKNELEELVSKIKFEDLPQLSISISMGLAQFPDHGKTADQLIQLADHHLYKYKPKQER